MSSTSRLHADDTCPRSPIHPRGCTSSRQTHSRSGTSSNQSNRAETIAISSPERTVVDLLGLRSRVGRDLALTALRRYLQSRDAKPGELLALARQLRIGTVMAEMLEPLLA